MKPLTRLLIVTVLCVAGATSGQQNGDAAPRHPRTLNRGNWVGKRVLTKEFMEKVGIQGEQAEKIKTELSALEAKSLKLEESINQEALKQAELAKKVLDEPGASVDEIMRIIERIGQHRTEQAKLAMRLMLVIRDNLTADQRKKASELLAFEGKRRIEERAAERAAREAREKNERPADKKRPAAPQGW